MLQGSLTLPSKHSQRRGSNLLSDVRYTQGNNLLFSHSLNS